MKTSLKTLFAVAAFGASALFASAQTAPKIAVIDLGKVFEGHYKTQEQQEKLKGVEAKIQDEMSKIVKDGQAMAEKYKELLEQTKNPVLTAEARTAAEADASKQLEEVQKKEQQYGQYRNDANRMLQQQVGTFKQMLVEEIAKVATDIAKKKGATLLIEKAATMYSDPSYDITDEVIAEINKTRPAPAPAAASTPAATPAPATSTPAPAAKPADQPAVMFPGAKK
jgi:outer membrane protein